MARKFGQDQRATYSQDAVRFRNLVKVPPAPQANTLELYFRQNVLYRLESNGVETPIGGFGASASPGFTWGKEGTVSYPAVVAADTKEGNYLWNDSVPSNFSGRLVNFNSPAIRRVQITNSQPSTYKLTIQQHDGTTYTDVVEVELSASRNAAIDVNIPVTKGLELSARVSEGTAHDPVVGIILDGLY